MIRNLVMTSLVLTGLSACGPTWHGPSGSDLMNTQEAQQGFYLDPADWIPVDPDRLSDSIQEQIRENPIYFPPEVVNAAEAAMTLSSEEDGDALERQYVMLPRTPQSVPSGIITSVQATAAGPVRTLRERVVIDAGGGIAVPFIGEGGGSTSRVSVIEARGREYKLKYTISLQNLLDRAGSSHYEFSIAGLPYAVFAFQEMTEMRTLEGQFKVGASGVLIGTIGGNASGSGLSELGASDSNKIYKITFVPEMGLGRRKSEAEGRLLSIRHEALARPLPSSDGEEFQAWKNEWANIGQPRVSSRYVIVDEDKDVWRVVTEWQIVNSSPTQRAQRFATENAPAHDSIRRIDWDYVVLNPGAAEPIRLFAGQTKWIAGDGTDVTPREDFTPTTVDMVSATIYRFTPSGTLDVIKLAEWVDLYSSFVEIIP